MRRPPQATGLRRVFCLSLLALDLILALVNLPPEATPEGGSNGLTTCFALPGDAISQSTREPWPPPFKNQKENGLPT